MVRIHREPPIFERVLREGQCLISTSAPDQRGQTGLTPVPSTRFAPVVQRTRIVGLHPTDAGSTPERRTRAGLARRSRLGVLSSRGVVCWGGSPRSIIARCWFDSNILRHFIRGLRNAPLLRPRQWLARSGA